MRVKLGLKVRAYKRRKKEKYDKRTKMYKKRNIPLEMEKSYTPSNEQYEEVHLRDSLEIPHSDPKKNKKKPKEIMYIDTYDERNSSFFIHFNEDSEGMHIFNKEVVENRPIDQIDEDIIRDGDSQEMKSHVTTHVKESDQIVTMKNTTNNEIVEDFELSSSRISNDLDIDDEDVTVSYTHSFNEIGSQLGDDGSVLGDHGSVIGECDSVLEDGGSVLGESFSEQADGDGNSMECNLTLLLEDNNDNNSASQSIFKNLPRKAKSVAITKDKMIVNLQEDPDEDTYQFYNQKWPIAKPSGTDNVIVIDQCEESANIISDNVSEVSFKRNVLNYHETRYSNTTQIIPTPGNLLKHQFSNVSSSNLSNNTVIVSADYKVGCNLDNSSEILNKDNQVDFTTSADNDDTSLNFEHSPDQIVPDDILRVDISTNTAECDLEFAHDESNHSKENVIMNNDKYSLGPFSSLLNSDLQFENTMLPIIQNNETGLKDPISNVPCFITHNNTLIDSSNDMNERTLENGCENIIHNQYHLDSIVGQIDNGVNNVNSQDENVPDVNPVDEANEFVEDDQFPQCSDSKSYYAFRKKKKYYAMRSNEYDDSSSSEDMSQLLTLPKGKKNIKNHTKNYTIHLNRYGKCFALKKNCRKVAKVKSLKLSSIGTKFDCNKKGYVRMSVSDDDVIPNQSHVDVSDTITEVEAFDNGSNIGVITKKISDCQSIGENCISNDTDMSTKIVAEEVVNNCISDIEISADNDSSELPINVSYGISSNVPCQDNSIELDGFEDLCVKYDKDIEDMTSNVVLNDNDIFSVENVNLPNCDDSGNSSDNILASYFLSNDTVRYIDISPKTSSCIGDINFLYKNNGISNEKEDVSEKDDLFELNLSQINNLSEESVYSEECKKGISVDFTFNKNGTIDKPIDITESDDEIDIMIHCKQEIDPADMSQPNVKQSDIDKIEKNLTLMRKIFQSRVEN